MKFLPVIGGMLLKDIVELSPSLGLLSGPVSAQAQACAAAKDPEPHSNKITQLLTRTCKTMSPINLSFANESIALLMHHS